MDGSSHLFSQPSSLISTKADQLTLRHHDAELPNSQLVWNSAVKSGEDHTSTGNEVVPNPGVVGWLEVLSASRASPAAGSAAAITGALGVSLLIKLA